MQKWSNLRSRCFWRVGWNRHSWCICTQYVYVFYICIHMIYVCMHMYIMSRWWFQMFLFSPVFDIYFSDGLKPPTRCTSISTCICILMLSTKTTSPWQTGALEYSIQKSRGFLWRSNFGKPTCCLDSSNDAPRTYYWSYGEEFGGHVSWRLNSLTPKKNGGPQKTRHKWGLSDPYK